MTETEILVAWAHAIGVGHHREAIVLLQNHQIQKSDIMTPLSRQLEVLLVLSRLWARLYEKGDATEQFRASPERFLCSFCGQKEDADRKILGGPVDNICNICTKEFVERFAAMKRNESS